jgi:hypothetical protein
MIALNMLTPFSLSELQSNIRKANFISVMTDPSNHTNIKMFPVHVRFFEPSKGVQVKLLELKIIAWRRSGNRK